MPSQSRSSCGRPSSFQAEGREYAADAYAASLGQAEDLAHHLTDQELPFDAPQRLFLFNPCEHPPVALGIERLLGLGNAGGSE